MRSPTTFAAAALAFVVAGAHAGPVLDAAKTGNAVALRGALAEHGNANDADADGTTALHWAVHGGNVVIVTALLDARANVAASNRYGVPPLHLAAENGDAAMVKLLLERGADANSVSQAGETALMTAARGGDVATLEALLAKGADPNRRETWKGQTALMWAAHENNAPAVHTLLAAGAERDARSKAGDFTPLLFAVRAGAVDATRALLDAGADVNQRLADGTSALVLAAANAHYEAGALLLERGADPNADAQGWTALHQIAWSRRWNMGFNLPGPAQTGGVDSLDLVRRLVARGADVNAREKKEPADGNRNKLDRIGATPFLLAAKSCDLPLMKALLTLGANAGIATNAGTTSVMAAAGVGIWAPGENPGTHTECLAAMQLAVDSGGGDVNAIDANGETALHGAVYRGGNLLAIQYLADRGARLDVANKKGWTPLIVADGVEYTPDVLKRYPEAAALIRKLLAERGLPVPETTQPGRVASVR